MKKHFNHDAFTCPLTERGYLLEGAFHRVAQSYKITYHDLPMLYVASILYLYGADFGGIYPSFKGKVPKGFGDVAGYNRAPSMYFSFHNKPIIHKKNEVEIISSKIKKIGYDFWYPYIGWSTPEGKKVRSIVKPILEKEKLTPEMINWNKKQEKFCNITGSWHSDFLKLNKDKYDFEFKAYIYGTDLRFTIIDKKSKKMSSKQVTTRQKEYSKLFNDFAEYLYKSFLSNAKGFPKCLYE